MSNDSFDPGPAVNITTHEEGERWTLVFARELHHSPDAVWTALADAGQLREWAPFDADRNLVDLGPATLTLAGGGDEQSPANVRRAERPHLLEYDWDTDLLRWELAPSANGTHLTLRHTVAQRDWLPRVAAGWHICLAVLERALSGDRIGRIVAEDAKPYWEPLAAAYTQQLGM